MTTIEIASHGASLAVDGSLLRVARRGARDHTFPIDDLDLVVLEVPAVLVSGAALGALASRGIPVMICDAAHRPVGWVHAIGAVPIFDARRAVRQAAIPARTRNRLWRSIVRAKIERQADVLNSVGRPDARLRRIASEVETGDPRNGEARAAQLYWPALFGRDFRRRGDTVLSDALDWGYTIIRSLVCRTIVASGLHPAIGLHHVATENPFNLADDLMEPFRPLIDRLVHELWRAQGLLVATSWKPLLAEIGEEPVSISGQTMRCRAALHGTVASFVRVIDEGKGSLELPSGIPEKDDA